MSASGVVAFERFLGREARSGTWAELCVGTFRAATEALRAGRSEDAARLVEVSVLEAEEARSAYGSWPALIIDWLDMQGADPDAVVAATGRLAELLGAARMQGLELGWPEYVAAAQRAADACRSGESDASSAIERARCAWQTGHDAGVDRFSGMVDIVVRLLGEEALPHLWQSLINDWYAAQADRYALSHQSWETSARQLMLAIVDGFHAHLSGPDRDGDIELIEEADRIGFRFAPCGSGGRSVAANITDGQPLAGPPYGFAVTTRPHDWSWGKAGICSYCVHCCLLNEIEPIDRLGYPLRVIDPPVWPADDATCTWWVYRHPALVPDDAYYRVGRLPDHRADSKGTTP